uniref:Putative phospholipid/glycerol acyltransferase n=1 Tax=Leptospirillum ferrodiazotrophum TaxID=412449 RepID=C6HTV5_9BACT|nr:MAG: putative phospholipid/glycerol acyltransferase [Leptospirillum ferrodiazotrophum]
MIRVVGTLPPGPGIVVAMPHVSHLDGPLLAACLPEPILWGVDPESMESQPWKAGLWLTSFLTGAEIVPLSSDRPFGYRALARRLRAGGKVGLFPEGGINRTSAPLLPFQPGAERLAQLCQVPIIPVRILGMREWIFSSAPAEKKRLVPRVRIEIEVGRFMFTLPNKDGF